MEKEAASTSSTYPALYRTLLATMAQVYSLRPFLQLLVTSLYAGRSSALLHRQSMEARAPYFQVSLHTAVVDILSCTVRDSLSVFDFLSVLGDLSPLHPTPLLVHNHTSLTVGVFSLPFH